MENYTLNPIDPNDFSLKELVPLDSNQIDTNRVDTVFNSSTDYIELYIYNIDGQILFFDTNFQDYTSNLTSDLTTGELYSQLTLNPAKDIESFGIDNGKTNVIYNFYKRILASSPQVRYFISEISSDRTEIGIKSTQIATGNTISSTNAFISAFNSTSYYPEFYINFGDNQTFLCVNIQLDDENPSDPTIYLKLYEPLSINKNVKDTLWVVEENSESIGFLVTFDPPIIPEFTGIPLSGPNYNLSIKGQINNSTDYTDYSTITSTELNLTSSFSQLSSLLSERGYDINVDYSKFENFIHLSSGVYRLENFAYKVGLIENYQVSASYSNTAGTGFYVSSSQNIWEEKIKEVITNFDGYEYYLYYTSSSTAWPKQNSTPPYSLYPTNSTQALTWLGSANPSSAYYGGQVNSASLYDRNNIDNILLSIPEYLRDDPENEGYELFMGMVGQHFDNIWIYLKDITEKYNADNRIDYGISKDLVSDAIKDFGVKLYQNNFSNIDLYSAFLGIDPSGSIEIFPNTTGSYPAPTGYEFIDNYVTSSNGVYPMDDVQKRNYKRIYHNLPYLLKKKGTLEGLRALISIYGIPNTILDISEFGGKNKDNINDWDYWKEKFNYKYDTSGSGWIQSPWVLDSNWNTTNPNTLELRFKTPGLQSGINTPSQSIWSLDDGSEASLVLEYTGSGFTSGSWSGSIADPENQYATLKFIPDGITSASVSLPFYDGGWWSVMVTKEDTNFTLYAGNNIYNGDDGNNIGFTGSASIVGDISGWTNSVVSYFPSEDRNDITSATKTYRPFSGSYQEIRYFTDAISQSVFDDYVMNPYSIEGNGISGSYETLAFRGSLGGELYTSSISIHPKITGSNPTQSFTSDSDFNINDGGFSNNREYFYLDQVPAGIKNRISNKINVGEPLLPSTGSGLPTTSSLSQYRSIQQNPGISGSYTEDVNYVEVAFSPANQINDDIIGEFGYFNLGDYIGDPRQVPSGSSTYPDLVSLSDYYFEKYKSNYDVFDFVRLIKFFDNSLFKMIKDFVPARANVATGIVIKQHLLERNKYTLPQVNIFTPIAIVGNPTASVFDTSYGDKNIYITGSIGHIATMSYDQRDFIQSSDYTSIPLYEYTGSSGGSMPILNGIYADGWLNPTVSTNFFVNITQSWTGTYSTPLGYVDFTDDTQEEFFDGEFSGSLIVATTQSLNPDNPFLEASTTLTNYSASIYSSVVVGLSNFESTEIIPGTGEMFLLYDSSI
tara:strand:+ start:848 stop:4546 length:3699 start_codon:yes stop_codon:yes gene_type:complete